MKSEEGGKKRIRYSTKITERNREREKDELLIFSLFWFFLHSKIINHDPLDIFSPSVLKVNKTKEKKEKKEEKQNGLLPKRKQFSFQDRREKYFEYSFSFKFQKKNQIHPKKQEKKEQSFQFKSLQN